MTRKLFLALFAAMTIGMLGCGSQEGETLMTSGPTSSDNIGKAPYTGTYMLYTSLSPNPTLTEKLDEGTKLGFRVVEGAIFAVYGEKEYPLPKGTAQVYWKAKK